MQSEEEPILPPKAEAASGSLSAEERHDWPQFVWGGIGRDSGKHSRQGRGWRGVNCFRYEIFGFI